MQELTKEQVALFAVPLPSEAITKHPTKTYLSTIKAIYVTERLNEIFGIGKWRISCEEIKSGEKGMIVVKVKLTVPEYAIEYESFGGNDNGGENSKGFDLGDAYKGAVTDAITKICSWMGIGIDVFKGKQQSGSQPQAQAQAPAQKPQPPVGDNDLKKALQEIEDAKSIDDLSIIWKRWSNLHGNQVFKNLVIQKKIDYAQ